MHLYIEYISLLKKFNQQNNGPEMTAIKIVLFCMLCHFSIMASNSINIIPLPNSIKITHSQFKLSPDTLIYCQDINLENANFLNDEIEKSLGYRLKYSKKESLKNCIELRQEKNENDES